VHKAIEIIKKVKKHFLDNNGLTNEQIYLKLIQGAEKLIPEDDNEMDLELELYYSSNKTVGYTYPNKVRVWMNTKYFTPYTPTQRLQVMSFTNGRTSLVLIMPLHIRWRAIPLSLTPSDTSSEISGKCTNRPAQLVLLTLSPRRVKCLIRRLRVAINLMENSKRKVKKNLVYPLLPMLILK
jgi:hypothetical protein